MALYSICFSPTGGTQKVLQILQNAWDTPAQEIDLTVPGADYASYHFAHTDVCLIAVPSFGGRVPSVALERLRFMHADRTPTVFIAVYGNRAIDDTLLELQRELRPNGFEACAAISAVAEHSIMHQFGTGRPDSADAIQLHQFAVKIQQVLSHPDHSVATLPGHFPYLPHHAASMHPAANEHCVQCGLCARRCPVGAIPTDAPNQTDPARCIGCMRCTVICPMSARAVDSAALSALIQRLEPACSGRKENCLYL